MRTLIGWCLVSLLAAATPVSALADGFPRYKVDAGISAKFNVYRYDPQTEAARLHPWYTYFPYEAHFQSPAPYGFYPNFPSRMVPGALAGQPPANPSGNAKDKLIMPEAGPAPTGPNLDPNPPSASNYSLYYPGVQPAGFYYGNVPSYWYGR